MFRKYLLGALTLALLSAPVLAHDGWERNSNYNKQFNPKAVQTITGKVMSINRNCRPLEGMEPGFSAVVQPAKGEPVEIQVGPAWFTNFYRGQWQTRVGDQVTVTGSVIQVGNGKVMLVTQGQKDNRKMTIRSKDGSPLWDVAVQEF